MYRDSIHDYDPYVPVPVVAVSQSREPHMLEQHTNPYMNITRTLHLRFPREWSHQTTLSSLYIKEKFHGVNNIYIQHTPYNNFSLKTVNNPHNSI